MNTARAAVMRALKRASPEKNQTRRRDAATERVAALDRRIGDNPERRIEGEQHAAQNTLEMAGRGAARVARPRRASQGPERNRSDAKELEGLPAGRRQGAGRDRATHPDEGRVEEAAPGPGLQRAARGRH